MITEELSLLARIDSIQVEAVSMISDTDKSVCQQLQDKFYEFREFAKRYIEFVTENAIDYEDDYSVHIEFSFRSPERMADEMRKQLKIMTRNFINKVVNHFKHTYSVDIDSFDWLDKYDESVTYEDIVREVIEQLDGLSFEDRAVQEIKTKSFELVRNKEVTVNKNKVSVGQYTFWWEQHYYHKDQFKPTEDQQKAFCAALSHFECGTTSVLPTLHRLTRADYHSYWFEKMEFPMFNKLQSIKFFKNGKVELVFDAPEQATQFAREYFRKDQ